MATVPLKGATSACLQKRCQVKREPPNRSPQRKNCSLRRAKRPLFLTKMTKKWPFRTPHAAILPLEAAKNAFFGKKEEKSALRKKKSRAGDRTRTQKEFFVTSIPVRVFLRFLPFLACRLKVVLKNHERKTRFFVKITYFPQGKHGPGPLEGACPQNQKPPQDGHPDKFVFCKMPKLPLKLKENGSRK